MLISCSSHSTIAITWKSLLFVFLCFELVLIKWNPFVKSVCNFTYCTSFQTLISCVNWARIIQFKFRIFWSHVCFFSHPSFQRMFTPDFQVDSEDEEAKRETYYSALADKIPPEYSDFDFNKLIHNRLELENFRNFLGTIFDEYGHNR